MDRRIREKMQRQVHFSLEHEIFRVAQKIIGDPSEYDIDIIGMGRVGYAVAKMFLQANPELIRNVRGWHRTKLFLDKGEIREMPLDNPQTRSAALLRTMTGRDDFDLRFYSDVNETREIAQMSLQRPERGRIVIVTPRYGLDFMDGDRPLDIDDPTDAKLIEHILRTTLAEVPNVKDAYELTQHETRVMRKIAKEVKEKYQISEGRAKGLVHNTIGIRELAKVQQGSIANTQIITNEVDTNTGVYIVSGRFDYRTVLGIGHHDKPRLEEEVRKQIIGARKKLELNVPLIGPHNEWMVEISELATLGGDPLLAELAINWEKARRDAIPKGLQLLEDRGSSDEDTAWASLQTALSTIYGYPIRAQAYVKKDHFITGEEDFVTGHTVVHDRRLAIPQLDELTHLTPPEQERYKKGVEMVQFVLSRLREEEIIEKEKPEATYQPPSTGIQPVLELERKVDALTPVQETELPDEDKGDLQARLDAIRDELTPEYEPLPPMYSPEPDLSDPDVQMWRKFYAEIEACGNDEKAKQRVVDKYDPDKKDNEEPEAYQERTSPRLITIQPPNQTTSKRPWRLIGGIALVTAISGYALLRGCSPSEDKTSSIKPNEELSQPKYAEK